MYFETLDESLVEAERFIRAANELKRVMSPEHRSKKPGTYPREHGAVHRASMDLTRKLADLRQGR